MQKPTTRALVEALGISRTYAHDILTGRQDPSLPLAASIFEKSGWRHRLVESLSDEAIAEIAGAHPWTPPQKQAAA